MAIKLGFRKSTQTGELSHIRRIKSLLSLPIFFLCLIAGNGATAQSIDSLTRRDITFSSEGVLLTGTLFSPTDSQVAIVLVHGSGQEKRMTGFAERMAAYGITVLTYDKRGVGASGGTYAGPEVGTNNVDSINLSLLAKDASAALNKLQEVAMDLPVGLVGSSQAGWIIPIAATLNPSVNFMVVFSGPTISSLEQLRFQFHTNGDQNYWENHSEAEAREHIKNDPDRFQFTATDPKHSLIKLAIPGLWLYGAKDIQVPAQWCIEQLNWLKGKGKPFEYRLYSNLGHNTGNAFDPTPVEDAIQWIKQQGLEYKKSSKSN
uniref:alpha/beta hydrolase family protein n=1 Tax=Algoriphagus sp. TaxID=1872435 RepID=UPI004048A465